MQAEITLEDFKRILQDANLEGFTGEFVSLGGGEVNDTYKLDFGDDQIILRVARDAGQQTLTQEARALNLLDLPHIPKLLFFNKDKLINNRLWILESYITGATEGRLTIRQFESLGHLLAQVHKVQADKSGVNLKEQFLDVSKHFGDEQFLLNHPNESLRSLIRKAFDEFERLQPSYDSIIPSLIHSDATPSNILVDGDKVGLIDWEFSKFNDPMADFSTVYYEDMEYNRGKWRIQIYPDEKEALFAGYENGGGKIDEERIEFWIRFDKLGAAVFLYWRLNQSTRKRTLEQTAQFKLDFNNLIASLNK